MGTTPVLSHPLRLLVLVLAALLIGIALAASSIRPASAVVGTCRLSDVAYEVPEDGVLAVTVLRTGGSDLTQVSYTVTGPVGTFNPQAGTVTIQPSAGSGSFNLVPVNDLIVTAPRELTVTIDDAFVSDPCGIGSPSTATITIVDDDGPQITSISPHSGSEGGGTTVVISGQKFTGSTCNDVKFGLNQAASCPSITANQITAVSPPGTGTVDIVIETPQGDTPNSPADDFTYAPGPIVHSVDPSSAPAGTTTPGIEIIGEGFTAGACPNGVKFNATNAAACTYNSPNMLTVTAPSHVVGNVDVRVTIGANTSPNTVDDDFDFLGNAPLVTSVTPNSGPTAGGTSVTITGQFLSNPLQVKFGTTNAASFTPVNSTTITAISPAVAGTGTVDVTVITPADTSPTAGTGNDFTYTLAPTITGLTPDTGPTGGNNNVIVSGTNLLGVTTVSFGGTNALSFVINDATQITAVAPPHALGTVNVSVTNASGTSPNVAADDYEYLGGPNITGVSPTGGPTAGGTVVTITGSGFTGVTAVSFGAVAATSFTFVSDTSITATSPAQALGTVHIRVSAPGGTSPEVNADRFTYGVPSVSALTPNSGPKTGGGFITITGSNFLGATIVLFGTNESPAIQVSSGTSIVAQVPAGTGVVHVRVQSPAGLSTTTDDDEYTYNALPTISSLSPSQGPVAGGTQVVITGTDLTGATSVAFGGNAATSFQVDSSTKITAVAPAGVPGAVTVRVVTPQGTSPTGSGTTYTYKSSTATVTYSLSFRWNLVTWAGPTGIDVIVALQSLDGNNETTSIYGDVTAVYFYQNPGWLRFFPAGVNIPGTNTLSVLVFGNAYWIALDEARSWVIPAGP